jgi:hypothetical protein
MTQDLDGTTFNRPDRTAPVPDRDQAHAIMRRLDNSMDEISQFADGIASVALLLKDKLADADGGNYAAFSAAINLAAHIHIFWTGWGVTCGQAKGLSEAALAALG